MNYDKLKSKGISPAKTLLIIGIALILAWSGLFVYVGLTSNHPNTGVSNSVVGSTVTTTLTHTYAVVSISEVSQQQGINSTLWGRFDPVAIYEKDNASVVTVSGMQNLATAGGIGPQQVLGSGIVVSYNSSFYVVTNFHVVDSLTGMTVTFWDGDAYPASSIGYDQYSDIAVVRVDAPRFEFHPLNFSSSSSLQVGETVVAIGNPFGLSGSETLGIVSQLGRTFQEQTTGNFSIADVIQFSAAINPGNSGGPLLDGDGNVIGITTATEGGSQGVGFAIPSDTVVRELPSLINTGSYDLHPYMGIQGGDMNYALAQAIGTNVTYGVLISQVTPGGPADKAGLHGGDKQAVIDGQPYIIGGDIIVSINGTRIVNYDAMASYLEGHALPGETIIVGIVRSGSLMTVSLALGTRPS